MSHDWKPRDPDPGLYSLDEVCATPGCSASRYRDHRGTIVAMGVGWGSSPCESEPVDPALAVAAAAITAVEHCPKCEKVTTGVSGNHALECIPLPREIKATVVMISDYPFVVVLSEEERLVELGVAAAIEEVHKRGGWTTDEQREDMRRRAAGTLPNDWAWRPVMYVHTKTVPVTPESMPLSRAELAAAVKQILGRPS